MGIIKKKGSIGTIKGKVGNLVATSWRKVDVAKSTPKARTKKPKEFQIPSDQSKRLSLMSRFLSLFTDVIKVGFFNKSNKNPAFQTAVQYNLANAVVADENDDAFVIDYKKIVFSRGTREIAWSTRILAMGNCTIRITWDIPSTSKLKVVGDDTGYVVIYNSTSDYSVKLTSYPPSKRKLRGLEMKISNAFLGDELHLWMYFESPNGKEISNSTYMGSLVLI